MSSDWEDIKEGLDIYVKWKEAKAKGRKARLEVQLWWQQAQPHLRQIRWLPPCLVPLHDRNVGLSW